VRPIAPLLLLPLAACEDWPLHAALPDPWEGTPAPTEWRDVTEDPGIGDDGTQLLLPIDTPARIRIDGEMSSCAWDPGGVGLPWPEIAIDEDGDGAADDVGPAAVGWYAGDVDRYAVELSAVARVSASLTWDPAPSEAGNSPYRPGDDGPWQMEADLDVLIVLFDTQGGGELKGAGGASARYPEDSGPPLPFDAGARAGVIVACHHAVPADYTLTLRLDPP
jgi:hypothetical protein